MKKTIKIIFILLFAFVGFSISAKVNAASASISASKTNVKVGESVTIYVKYNAAAWNLKASGSGISQSYADASSDGNNTSATMSIKLEGV